MTTRTEPVSSPAAPPATPLVEALVGKRVHKYDIIRVIGRGGMGTVYEAVNTAIGKRVAMKFIDADTVNNADAVARFQREAQAASAVESAHIVDIFDSGISEEGQPYIVMELLRGEDLGHRIKRCGRLDLPEAVHVTAQILRGLARAHQAGIVHRDLKPDNIFLVDRDDDPSFTKILDFGISKVRRRGETPVHTLTRQGTVLGTPFYMSPEQAQALPDVDARSDLWAVGAILYECLTGRPPYTGGSYEQVIVNICMNDAEDVRAYNPGVPELVALVIARALARDRDERFQDAREFLDALRSGSGALISSRGGEDGFVGVVSSDPALMPISSGRTPSSPVDRRRSTPSTDPALDATLKFHSTPPPDQPRGGSLALQRRADAARRRRTFALVAVSALLAGGLGAFVVTRTWVRPGHEEHAHLSSERPPVTLAGGEGPAPLPATPPESVRAPEHSVPEPSVDPVAVAPLSDAIEPRNRTPKPGHGGPLPPSSANSHPVVPTVKAAETTSPATGVAPGLKLKTE